MPLSVQAKLLTVVEDKQVRRVGGSQPTRIDVRIIAATHRSDDDLRQMVREDLYYRLTTLVLQIPPMSERPGDIPELIRQALQEYNEQNHTEISLDDEIVQRLREHRLPGNIRQLRNLVWKAAAEAEDRATVISWGSLPHTLKTELLDRSSRPAAPVFEGSHSKISSEEALLRQTSEQMDGDVQAMAVKLGIHRTTVVRKLRSYGIPYTGSRLLTLKSKKKPI